jgi:hypothetical protein
MTNRIPEKVIEKEKISSDKSAIKEDNFIRELNSPYENISEGIPEVVNSSLKKFIPNLFYCFNLLLWIITIALSVLIISYTHFLVIDYDRLEIFFEKVSHASIGGMMVLLVQLFKKKNK